MNSVWPISAGTAARSYFFRTVAALLRAKKVPVFVAKLPQVQSGSAKAAGVSAYLQALPRMAADLSGNENSKRI